MSHCSSVHSLGTHCITLQQLSPILVGRSKHFDRLEEPVHKAHHKMTGARLPRSCDFSREEKPQVMYINFKILRLTLISSLTRRDYVCLC